MTEQDITPSNVRGVVFVDGQYLEPFEAIRHLIKERYITFADRWLLIRNFQRQAGVPVTPEKGKMRLLKFAVNP